MSVIIGHASGDEHGGAYGGTAGDQTKREVYKRNWYKHSKGWRVFRANDPAARERIAHAMERACDNDLIGYDQYQRDTLYKAAEPYGFDPGRVKAPCETDCSALVRVCCAFAGIGLPNINTQTEPDVLLRSGAFTELTGSEYTDSSDKLLRGDILVTRTKGHTMVVLSDGSKAGGPPTLVRGDKGEDVRLMQQRLLYHGFSVGVDGADGDFGKNTEAAVRAFQRANNLTDDGVCGAATWAALNASRSRYTVIIRGLEKEEADAMQNRWPDCEVISE